MVWQANSAPPNADSAAMRQQMEHSGGIDVPSIDPSNPFLSSVTRENQELSRRKAEHMEALEHIAPPHGFVDYNALRTSRLTDKTLREYFHLPLSDVAKKFGMCTTAFKKLCRKEGIMQWPYRTLRSLEKKMASLRAEQKFTHDQFMIEDQISKLQAKREAILAGTGLSSLSEDELSSPSHIPSDDSSTSGSTSSINSAERSCSSSPKPAQLMNALALNESQDLKPGDDRKNYRRMVSMNDLERYTEQQQQQQQQQQRQQQHHQQQQQQRYGSGSGGGGGGGGGGREGAGGGGGGSSGSRSSTTGKGSASDASRSGSAQSSQTRSGPPPPSSSASLKSSVKRSASFDFPAGAERPPYPGPPPYGGAWPPHAIAVHRPPPDAGDGGRYGRGGYAMGPEGYGHDPKMGGWSADPVLLRRFNDLIAENMSLRGVIRSMEMEKEQLAGRRQDEEAELAKYQVKTEQLEEQMKHKDVDPKGKRGQAAPRPRASKPQRPPAAARPQHRAGPASQPAGASSHPPAHPPHPPHARAAQPHAPQAPHLDAGGAGMPHAPHPAGMVGLHPHAAAAHAMAAHAHAEAMEAHHHGMVGAGEEGPLEMEFDSGAFLHGDEAFLPGSPSGMELWTDGGHHDFGV